MPEPALRHPWTTGLYGRLRADAGDDYRRYVGHEFVRRLGEGTLPAEAFRTYLVQDYLYLIQFARAYALAAYKSPDLAGMRRAMATMQAILGTETPLHIRFCAQWGLTEADLEAAPESLPLLAYSRFLIDRAMTGDILDLMVATSVCTIGYAEIGHALRDKSHPGHPYADWIDTYLGPPYQTVAAEAAAELDRLAADYGAEARYPMLLAAFRTAARLEAAFWMPEMA